MFALVILCAVYYVVYAPIFDCSFSPATRPAEVLGHCMSCFLPHVTSGLLSGLILICFLCAVSVPA